LNRKGFVFTIDALFAVALVTSLFALFFLAGIQPPSGEKLFELEQLGFDSLALESEKAVLVSNENFTALTGLSRSGDANAFSSAAIVAHARYYRYPALCGCASSSCVVAPGDACLASSDLLLGVYGANYSEVWVSP